VLKKRSLVDERIKNKVIKNIIDKIMKGNMEDFNKQ
jgi:hypothetical protein